MPTSTQKIGCLGSILHLFGITPQGLSDAVPQTLPYRLRDDFLSPAERPFYPRCREDGGGKNTT